MANPEVTLVVENSEEKADEVTSLVEKPEEKADEVTSLMKNSDEEQGIARNPDSNSTTTPSASGCIKATISILCGCCILILGSAPAIMVAIDRILFKLVKLPFQWIYPMWKKIFVISCVAAVLLDPLFLYIPIIKQDMKCIEMDRKLNEAAFALRSLTDFSYVFDIIVQFYEVENFSITSIAQRIWHSNILIDISAILPLPQAVILIFFSKGSGSFNTRGLMNSLALLQYVPRVLRIYFSCKELKGSSDGNIKLWVKGVLNFFMYILASHVLGAFWYFFAIQQMTTCWRIACRSENICESSTFVCKDEQMIENRSSFLNDLCPINPPNATLFDFGIFGDVLESGISESANPAQKFSNCFWWGLRNLSSLGSNLETSVNTWENLFAAFISIIGLLLFLYLIGNLQTYMQSDATKVEELKRKIQIDKMVEDKGTEISKWLSENVIGSERVKDTLKSKIMRKVKQELEQKIEQGRDVPVEEILSFLPSEFRSNNIDSHLIWKKFKAVPKLHSMNEEVLKAMFKYLTPKKYTENSYIIQENDRLEMMLLIVDGHVKVESRSSNGVSRSYVGTGHFYGEELLDWVNVSLFPTLLPLSTSSAKAISDVDARVLMASDLCAVAAFFCEHFSENTFAPPPVNVQYTRLGLHNLPVSTPTSTY